MNNTIWSVILEIIKISIPALIVGITVYQVLKSFLTKQSHLKLIENQGERQKTVLPIRLQAYERLAMFCERISIPNLVLRFRDKDMSAIDLKISMILAIRQEFEHNISQQIYISDNLWKILTISRDEVVNVITQIADNLPEGADGVHFSRALFGYLSQQDETALDKAASAVRKEAGTLF